MTKVHSSSLAPELEKEIRSIVGAKNFFIDKIGITKVLNQRSRSRPIIVDEENRSDFSAVVLPETTAQASGVVRALYDSGVAMVPYGGGTGLMGGALPLSANVCVSMRKMNKILDVDKVAKTFVVQSGVILGDLEKELNRSSLILGHDPWSRSYATIGGSIA
ncbi:MAG: FAD-binding protein, partial [Thaumarchaeota archaeon]|nr:FAD-binding protein [Nitrososphaerota archaeon]